MASDGSGGRELLGMASASERLIVRRGATEWRAYLEPPEEISSRTLATACRVALNGTQAQLLAFMQLCALELGTPPRGEP